MEERIWHKSYVAGVPRSITYEQTTLVDNFERTIRTYPQTDAVIMMGKRLTYAEIGRLVDRLAAALSGLGLKKGDKVALSLPNIPQALMAAYAVFKLGAVVVMVNPLYTEREMEHQLKDSEARAMICLDLLVPRILKVKPKTNIEIIVAAHIRDYLPFPAKQLFPYVKKGMHRPIASGEPVHDFMDLINKGPDKPPRTEVLMDDLAALLYTGGTTGLSKGVMLTHRNCSCVIQQMRAWLFDAQSGKERVIAIFPYFHVAGFTAMMNLSFQAGYTQILVPRPEPQTVLDLTRKYRPTFFGCVPTIYVGLLNLPDFPKTDFSFITGCLSGAAPLALETIKAWETAVGATIVEVYGMTECTTLCHANPWRGHTKVGSVGIPIPDTDCRIVDLVSGTQDMSVGQSGEIVIKGPQVSQGYYRQPEESAQSFRDGWFFTGDIGYMDEDGYLFIVDRKKDMVIAGGYNIYPREIDEILYSHPAIQEACAVGIPDPYRGETIKAFVVLRAGTTCTAEEIIAYCRERLAAYKVPKLVEFRNELPKSAVGKILRRTLREMEISGNRQL